MKKILLTLAIALTASISFGQRTIDWSVEEIVSPTVLNSTTTTGVQFQYDIVLKNNGSDAVYTYDSFAIQLYVKNTANQNTLWALPNGSLQIFTIKKQLDPGDTMHFVGTATVPSYWTYSYNVDFYVVTLIVNRGGTDPITTETSTTTANNSKSRNMIQYNPYNWGVGLNTPSISSLSIYPNPAKDMIKITLDKIEINAGTEVQIYDMQGRMVQNETIADATDITINTSALNKGMYLVKVINGESISSSKVSIQ